MAHLLPRDFNRTVNVKQPLASHQTRKTDTAANLIVIISKYKFQRTVAVIELKNLSMSYWIFIYQTSAK